MPALLSSRRLPDPQELEALLPIALPESVVAVVPNARDDVAEVERRAKVGVRVANPGARIIEISAEGRSSSR